GSIVIHILHYELGVVGGLGRVGRPGGCLAQEAPCEVGGQVGGAAGGMGGSWGCHARGGGGAPRGGTMGKSGAVQR
ncbi:unnamed protein product, partial [Lampetra planeri]